MWWYGLAMPLSSPLLRHLPSWQFLFALLVCMSKFFQLKSIYTLSYFRPSEKLIFSQLK